MPEGRGGYQRPKRPQPPSGPGRFSRRTDANQPITPPDLDNPDVNYGDVKASAEAQAVAPIPRGAGHTVTQGMGRPGAAGGGGRPPEALPPFLAEIPTARPGEPGSAGLPFGPGGGPEMLQAQPEPSDTREAVLRYLAIGFNNAEAAKMLGDYHAAAPAGPEMGTPAPGPEIETGPPMEAVMAAEPEPLPSEQMMPEEEQSVYLGPPTPEEEVSPEGEVSPPSETAPPSEEGA